jgi:tetratricopeptide (TPR) repeat protein
LQTLSLAAVIDPARPDIRIELSRVYRSKGSLNKAEEQLGLATPRSNATLASSYYRHQQIEFDLYLERGLVNLQRGQLATAVGAFKKVLEMDPNHGPANRYLAEVYLLRGLYAQSLEHAVRAEKLGFPLPEDKRKLLQEGLRRKKTGGRE